MNNTIDDAGRTNHYSDRNNRSLMGNYGRPKFFSGAGAVTPDSGNYISAIQADGAADVVYTGATYTDNTAYSMTGDQTILAGASIVLPCLSITISSGKGIVYQEPLTRNV